MTTYFIQAKEIFLILFLSYILGNLFLKIIKFNVSTIYTKIFFELFTGIVILTIGQSIVATKFNTILLVIPVLFCFGYYRDRQSFSQTKTSDGDRNSQIKKSAKYLILFELVLLTIIFFSIKFFAVFEGGDTNLINTGLGDFMFYAGCSDYMLATGIEACNNDYLFDMTNRPYHYADLWFISVISHISGGVTYFSLILTFRVIFLTVLWFGIMAILENRFYVDFKVKIAVTLAIFFAPLHLEIYNAVGFLRESSLFTQTYYESPKLFFVQILIIAGILLHLINYRKLAITALLLIPVFYITPIVDVFMAFLLYLTFIYYTRRKIIYDELIIFILAASSIFIFYFLINPSNGEMVAIERNLLDLFNFKHTINIIGGTVLSHSLLYLPACLMLFIYIYYKKTIYSLAKTLKENPIYIFISTMPIFGLLLWSITSGNVNSVQLFYNISLPVFYTGSILLFLFSFNSLNKYFKFIIFSFLFLTAIHELPKFPEQQTMYSSNFIEEIKNKEALFGNLIVTYKPASYYTSLFMYYDKVTNLGNYFAFIKNNTQRVSLDMLEVHVDVADKDIHRHALPAVKSSTFYRYVDGKKKEGILKDNSEYQLDFIKEHDVRFLVTLKSVKLPDYLNNLVVRRIEDDVSGEVVCLLDNQKIHKL